VKCLNREVIKMSVVKIVTNKPGPAPKPEEVGKSKEVKIPEKMKPMVARGMGAAVKGGGYMGYD
jgi:hypothetical protein